MMRNVMAQGKQAKILSPAQIRTTLQFLDSTRNPERDKVMFLLSVKAGMRAKEIASVTWAMVIDSDGNIDDAIQLQDIASKGKGGRTIPLNKELKIALMDLKEQEENKRLQRGFPLNLASTIISSERGEHMSANSIAHWFKRLYQSNLGFDSCSSHSGRRTAITNWSRNVSRAGGSLRDVQALAGHSSLAMTQLYIEQNSDAQKKLIDMG
jgi:integrase